LTSAIEPSGSGTPPCDVPVWTLTLLIPGASGATRASSRAMMTSSAIRAGPASSFTGVLRRPAASRNRRTDASTPRSRSVRAIVSPTPATSLTAMTRTVTLAPGR